VLAHQGGQFGDVHEVAPSVARSEESRRSVASARLVWLLTVVSEPKKPI
jgi:hypothetical protein